MKDLSFGTTQTSILNSNLPLRAFRGLLTQHSMGLIAQRVEFTRSSADGQVPLTCGMEGLEIVSFFCWRRRGLKNQNFGKATAISITGFS